MQLVGLEVSRPVFLTIRVTWAFLNCTENKPSAKDKFDNRAMTLTNTPLQSFSNFVEKKFRGNDQPVIGIKHLLYLGMRNRFRSRKWFSDEQLSDVVGSGCLPLRRWSMQDLIMATLSAKKFDSKRANSSSSPGARTAVHEGG